MARKKQYKQDKNNSERSYGGGFLSNVEEETKRSVAGIALIGCALIFSLAVFQKAGVVGDFLFSFFGNALGVGYYLLPAALILIGLHLMTSGKESFMGLTIFGTFCFLISGIGLLDVVVPGEGGLVGNWIGSLELLFGYWASIVVFAVVGFSAILVALNTSLTIELPSIRDMLEKRKEERLARRLAEKELIIHEPEAAPDTDADGVKEEPAEEEKHEEEEKEVAPIPSEKHSIKAKLVALVAPGLGTAPVLSANYTLPPLSLLKVTIEKPTGGDLRANANIIKRTLESFGIPGEMGEITVGPKVTQYTMKPAEGIKLSRITTLNQDLSLALAAYPLRIEAPIPGKALVGIEIPNKVASIVRLGSLLGYDEFKNSGPLVCALGRNVAGEPVMFNIAKMPHVLIAGTTGSGKSVAIHTLIVSLLYKNSPETLRLILIDPKRVELSVYDGIPHLASSVITEGKKAIAALKFCIDEMERRYDVLLKAGVRDIAGFNKKKEGADRLPYLLIIVDELADLMVTYGREVESYIVRLAQMARATGIHLVLSTQRPSVDVITGLIKANIPSRIALQVASQIDSRTILDMGGAEKLLGGGDMLFLSADTSKPVRIQGAYLHDDEIKKVVDFIKETNTAPMAAKTGKGDELAGAIEEHLSDGPKTELDAYLEGNVSDGDGADEDDMFDEAVEVVKEAQKASASLLQRRLRVGYARAARLLDIMEERGIIGPGDGAKPREVFIDNDHETE